MTGELGLHRGVWQLTRQKESICGLKEVSSPFLRGWSSGNCQQIAPTFLNSPAMTPQLDSPAFRTSGSSSCVAPEGPHVAWGILVIADA